MHELFSILNSDHLYVRLQISVLVVRPTFLKDTLIRPSVTSNFTVSHCILNVTHLILLVKIIPKSWIVALNVSLTFKFFSYQKYSRLHPEASDGLLVLSVEDYLQCFWPALKDAQSLLQSLMESLSLKLSKNSAVSAGSHSAYWTDDVIKEKLKKVRT